MAALHRPEDAVTAGASREAAKAAVILIHGRGATPESMLPLAEAFGRDDVHYVVPRAGGNTWYPYPFLAPIEANEPWLSSALGVIGTLVERLSLDGFASERIGLVGFSQGACLTAEFMARNPRRYGMAGVLTGGLIGPPGTPHDYPGSLAGTPVFIGSSDVDPHIPLQRVHETRDVLTRMGAEVDARIYHAMDHTVNEDEIEAVRKLLDGITASKP